jgi:hypothetical protein
LTGEVFLKIGIKMSFEVINYSESKCRIVMEMGLR